jgi:hypothetical protein
MNTRGLTELVILTVYPARKARTGGLAEEKTEDARLSPSGTGGDPSKPD